MSEFIVKHASEHVVAKAKIEREYAAAETAVNDEIAKYASVSRSTFEKAKADLYQRWDPGFEQLNANLLKSESARMAHLVTSRGQNEALSPEGAAISAQLEERVKTFGVDQNLTRAAAWARLRQIDADFAALDDRWAAVESAAAIQIHEQRGALQAHVTAIEWQKSFAKSAPTGETAIAKSLREVVEVVAKERGISPAAAWAADDPRIAKAYADHEAEKLAARTGRSA